MKNWQAIAAMARNRVIGIGNSLPWHLPEDFRWFKKTTMGKTIVMGRKTYESIGRPLPGRNTVILSQNAYSADNTSTCKSLNELASRHPNEELFFCGGALVYEQVLPYCENLYLTQVKMNPEGDAFFPKFEENYDLAEILAENSEFSILNYRNKSPLTLTNSDL